jgi:hypothetical protein
MNDYAEIKCTTTHLIQLCFWKATKQYYKKEFHHYEQITGFLSDLYEESQNPTEIYFFQ